MLMIFAINGFIRCDLSLYGSNLSRFMRNSHQSGALTLCPVQQSSSCQVNIGQRAQYKQGMSTLGETPVANLGKTKYPLRDTKDMLDLGPDARLRAITQSIACFQRPMPAAFNMG